MPANSSSVAPSAARTCRPRMRCSHAGRCSAVPSTATRTSGVRERRPRNDPGGRPLPGAGDAVVLDFPSLSLRRPSCRGRVAAFLRTLARAGCGPRGHLRRPAVSPGCFGLLHGRAPVVRAGAPDPSRLSRPVAGADRGRPRGHRAYRLRRRRGPQRAGRAHDHPHCRCRDPLYATALDVHCGQRLDGAAHGEPVAKSSHGRRRPGRNGGRPVHCRGHQRHPVHHRDHRQPARTAADGPGAPCLQPRRGPAQPGRHQRTGDRGTGPWRRGLQPGRSA